MSAIPGLLLKSDGAWMCLVPLLLVVGIAVLRGIVGAVRSGGSSGGLRGFIERRKVGDGELSATLLGLRGTLHVPVAPCTVAIRTLLLDITDGAAKPMPVLCLLEQFADENGFFQTDNTADVPHAAVRVERIHAALIPDQLIVCPRRGHRRLRAFVRVVAPISGPVAVVEHDFDFQATSIGYEEVAQKAAESRAGLAKVAFATAGVDGELAESELELIESLFKQRFSTKENKAVRDELRTTMKDVHARVRRDPSCSTVLVREGVASLKEDDEMKALAFEFAVRIAAADGTLAPPEERFLQALGMALGIPEAHQRSAREKFIRLSMYEGAAADGRARTTLGQDGARQALGMPSGLSPDEQRKWLTAEYRKWNGRVTNPDPKIREEAEARLKAIAMLRSRL
jgi:tellurite resistance protein